MTHFQPITYSIVTSILHLFTICFSWIPLLKNWYFLSRSLCGVQFFKFDHNPELKLVNLFWGLVKSHYQHYFITGVKPVTPFNQDICHKPDPTWPWWQMVARTKTTVAIDSLVHVRIINLTQAISAGQDSDL